MTTLRYVRLALTTMGLFATMQIPIMSQDRPMRLEVRTPDGMQSAIDRIACGGVIVIQNDLIVNPHWRLRDQDRPGELPCTTDTIIRREGPLPGPFNVTVNCVTVGPTFAADMATRNKCWQAQREHYGKGAPKVFVETSHAQQGQAWAIYSDCNANHWRIQGIEIGSRSTLLDPPVYALVFLGGSCEGDGFGYFKNRDQIGHHITFEQVWCHGLSTTFSGPRPQNEPASSTRRCILANADHFTFKDSLLDDFAEIGQDSQGILVYNAYGPFAFDNLFIDAAGENIMFGGADPSRELPGLIPCDINISNSYLTKNWNRWAEGAKVGYSNSPFNWQSKNSLEFKNACRANVWGSVIEASWAYNQSGMIVMHQSMNQDGTCLHCVVRDVDHFQNIVRWGAEMFGFGGKTGQMGGSAMARNIKFRDTLAYGIEDYFGWASTANPPLVGTGGTAFKLISGSASGSSHEPLTGMHLLRNTIINRTQIAAVGNCEDKYADFKYAGNLARAGMPWYDAQITFCASAGGKIGFDLFFGTDYEIERNVTGTDGGLGAPWPASNVFLSTAAFADLFVDYKNMDYRLKPGSPYEGLGVDFSKLPGLGKPNPNPPTPPPPCTYTVGPTTASVPSTGGPLPLTIAKSADTCANPALATSEAWMAISAAYPPVVTVDASALTIPRVGAITLNGAPVVTVTQAAYVPPPPPACVVREQAFTRPGGTPTDAQWTAFIATKRQEGWEYVSNMTTARAVFRKICP